MLLLYLGVPWGFGAWRRNNEILSGKVISDWTPKRRQSLPKQPVLRQTASGSPELDGGVFLSTGYLPAGPVSCSGEGEKKKKGLPAKR